MNEQKRVVFTKEELSAKVKVPAIVEQDLKRIISDRLEQCGMYYRVFSRIKTAGSMAHKFETKEYGEGRKKLQDLVGVRVNLYFDDDVDICRNIMENTFDVIDWSTSEMNDEEFKPTKLNGVCRLPAYLRSEISPETWKMCIDDTFEIQIKTMFFEGWHEIEHDMRYKGEELWKNYKGFSRYFNSILATPELCDKSMVTLFEDLGHSLYKSGRWSDMIKSHFRLKLGEGQLYPEVARLLDEDCELQVENLAKRIYKTSKQTLVDQLLHRSRKVPINVNTIIALLNDSQFHDSRLTAIFRQRDVYNDGREESQVETRHYEMKPLTRHTVFQVSTRVDGSRLKEEAPEHALIFHRTSEVIYGWLMEKYGSLFKNMPGQLCTWKEDIFGYHAAIEFHPEEQKMKLHVRHMDMEVGGRIWYSECALENRDQDGVWLQVCNGYAEPEREHVVQDPGAIFFSYPGFYKGIVDNIGIINGIECISRRRILKEEQFAPILHALKDSSCMFPFVVIISKKADDGMMDEDWLGQFRVSDFTRTVWRYAHVFTCYEDTGRKFLSQAGLDGQRADIPRLYIFWPDGDVDDYGSEDVRNCSFGRHLEARGDARTYDIVRGGQAFYHKILTDLREWNVSADICQNLEETAKEE